MLDRDASPRPLATEIAQDEELLRKAHEASRRFLEPYLGSQNAADYYYLQYAFDGALSMYEATRSVAWLDWVVTASFELVQRARPMLDGELGWAWFAADGRPNELTGDSILCEYQIARPMLRAATLATSIPDYPHSAEARAIGAFVLDHIMAKWLDRRAGWAGAQRPSELGKTPWFVKVEAAPEWESMLQKAARSDHPWLDTWSMAGELYLRAYRLTGTPSYKERAITLAGLFKRRQRGTPAGPWTWDQGVLVGPWSEHGGNTSGYPDTGHANREVAWVVEGYLSHVGFDRSDVDDLVATLEQRIVQPSSPSLFRNYINGADTPYRAYAFNGSTASIAPVFDGWVRLSWISREALGTFHALLLARRPGEANSTIWADLSLPGHLALGASLQAH